MASAICYKKVEGGRGEGQQAQRKRIEKRVGRRAKRDWHACQEASELFKQPPHLRRKYGPMRK